MERIRKNDRPARLRRSQISKLDRLPVDDPRKRYTALVRIVYAVQVAGLVKIGVCNNIKTRVTSIRRAVKITNGLEAAPEATVLMQLSFSYAASRHVENWFHRQLAAKWVTGEWFKITADDLRPLKVRARHHARHVEKCLRNGVQLERDGRGRLPSEYVRIRPRVNILHQSLRFAA